MCTLRALFLSKYGKFIDRRNVIESEGHTCLRRRGNIIQNRCTNSNSKRVGLACNIFLFHAFLSTLFYLSKDALNDIWLIFTSRCSIYYFVSIYITYYTLLPLHRLSTAAARANNSPRPFSPQCDGKSCCRLHRDTKWPFYI